MLIRVIFNTPIDKREVNCNCVGCKKPNCGKCKMCLDMPKFGGPGRKKKRCLQRKCTKQAELSTSVRKIDSCTSRSQPATVQGFNLTLVQVDLNTLTQPLHWLNDNVRILNDITLSLYLITNYGIFTFSQIINFYLSLLTHEYSSSLKQKYAFNSFFYTKLQKDGLVGVKSWTKKVSHNDDRKNAHTQRILPPSLNRYQWTCTKLRCFYFQFIWEHIGLWWWLTTVNTGLNTMTPYNMMELYALKEYCTL